MQTETIKDGKVVGTPTTSKGVLHNIFIIDASGSMNQSSYVNGKLITKYEVAKDAINSEVNTLKQDDQGDVTLSVFEFDSALHGTERITTHAYLTPLKDVGHIRFRGAIGNTPLYQTIEYVINRIGKDVFNKDNVLIKIFTDGRHNCRWGITEKDCKKLIQDVQEKRDFIITYVGLEEDVEHVIDTLGMERGNTYSYDGSTLGFMASNTAAMGQTVNSVSDMRAGRSLKSKTFFSSAPIKLRDIDLGKTEPKDEDKV